MPQTKRALAFVLISNTETKKLESEIDNVQVRLFRNAFCRIRQRPESLPRSDRRRRAMLCSHPTLDADLEWLCR